MMLALGASEVKIITGINKNKVCQSLSVFLIFTFNPNPRSLAILFQTQLLEKLEQAENKQHIIDCLKTLNSRTQDAIFMQYFHHTHHQGQRGLVYVHVFFSILCSLDSAIINIKP
jgi:hypothetical protein